MVKWCYLGIRGADVVRDGGALEEVIKLCYLSVDIAVVWSVKEDASYREGEGATKVLGVL